MSKLNLDNIDIILDHFYDDEITDLEQLMLDEGGSDSEALPDKLDDAIKFCEDNNYTSHIAYNLMLLKRDLQKK